MASEHVSNEMQVLEQLLLDVINPDRRETALAQLAKKKGSYQELAPLLWNSFGTMSVFIQEIVSVYPRLSPPNLNMQQSTRVCNVIALLQCVAAHPDTRIPFLKAHFTLYLNLFLNTTNKSKPFEHLRLTSLGVIGALVKSEDPDIMRFLISGETVPLCLRAIEFGSDLSKTVATFIIQNILQDDLGLDYICNTLERVLALCRMLANIVVALAEKPSPSLRLLKYIISCYLQLSKSPMACVALRSSLPDMFRNGTFSQCLLEDETTFRRLQQLLHNVQGPHSALQSGVGF